MGNSNSASDGSKEPKSGQNKAHGSTTVTDRHGSQLIIGGTKDSAVSYRATVSPTEGPKSGQNEGHGSTDVADSDTRGHIVHGNKESALSYPAAVTDNRTSSDTVGEIHAESNKASNAGAIKTNPKDIGSSASLSTLDIVDDGGNVPGAGRNPKLSDKTESVVDSLEMNGTCEGTSVDFQSPETGSHVSDSSSKDFEPPEEVSDKFDHVDGGTSGSSTSLSDDGSSSDSGDFSSEGDHFTGQRGTPRDGIPKMNIHKISDSNPSANSDSSGASVDCEDFAENKSNTERNDTDNDLERQIISYESLYTNRSENVDKQHIAVGKHAKHSENLAGQVDSLSHNNDGNLTYTVNSDSDSSLIEVFLESGCVNSPEVNHKKLQSKADLRKTYTISTCLQKTDTLCSNTREQPGTDYGKVCSTEKKGISQKSVENRLSYTAKNKREAMSSSEMTGSETIDTGRVLDTDETDSKMQCIGCTLPGLTGKNCGIGLYPQHDKSDKLGMKNVNDIVQENENNDLSSEDSGRFGINDKDTDCESQAVERNNNSDMTVKECVERVLVSHKDATVPCSNLDRNDVKFDNMSMDLQYKGLGSVEIENKSIVACSTCSTKDTVLEEFSQLDIKDSESSDDKVYPDQKQDTPSTSKVNVNRNPNHKMKKGKHKTGLVIDESHVILTDDLCDRDALIDDSALSELNQILCRSEPDENVTNQSMVENAETGHCASVDVTECSATNLASLRTAGLDGKPTMDDAVGLKDMNSDGGLGTKPVNDKVDLKNTDVDRGTCSNSVDVKVDLRDADIDGGTRCSKLVSDEVDLQNMDIDEERQTTSVGVILDSKDTDSDEGSCTKSVDDKVDLKATDIDEWTHTKSVEVDLTDTNIHGQRCTKSGEVKVDLKYTDIDGGTSNKPVNDKADLKDNIVISTKPHQNGIGITNTEKESMNLSREVSSADYNQCLTHAMDATSKNVTILESSFTKLLDQSVDLTSTNNVFLGETTKIPVSPVACNRSDAQVSKDVKNVNVGSDKESHHPASGRRKLRTAAHSSQVEMHCSKEDETNTSVESAEMQMSGRGGRSHLSFAGLFSAHTFAEETDGQKSPKKQNENRDKTHCEEAAKTDSPLAQRKASPKHQLFNEKTKGGSLGSGRKGRSRRSNKGLPQQVKEYWKHHLAKYSTVSDRAHGKLDNLKDITNFDVLRTMGRVGTKEYNGMSPLLCASDGDLNSSSQEYHKYSKLAQSTNQLDFVGGPCQTVCPSSGLINRWSSNLSLHSDHSQLTHEDTEKTLAARDVDLPDRGQQHENKSEESRQEISIKTGLLNTQIQSEVVCVNPIKSSDIIISSERSLKHSNGISPASDSLQVEHTFVNSSIETHDVISSCNNNHRTSTNDCLVLKKNNSPAVDRVRENVLSADSDRSSNTSSPCYSVRSDGTESPSSLTVSLVSKPPSGVKNKKSKSQTKTIQKKLPSHGNSGKKDTDHKESKSRNDVRRDKESSPKKRTPKSKAVPELEQSKGRGTKDPLKSADQKVSHSSKASSSTTTSGMKVTDLPKATSPKARDSSKASSSNIKYSSKASSSRVADDDFENKMLKTLISNNTSSEVKSEDDMYHKPLNRSWSGNVFTTDNQSREDLPDKNLDSTILEKGVKKTTMRRTMSDLGFAPSRPNRTASLLKNPLMRKHLARTMGLSAEASEDDIKEAIDEKLETTMRQNNLGMGRSNSTMSLSSRRYDNEDDANTQKRSSLKLCRTSSLSDGINSTVETDFLKDYTSRPDESGSDSNNKPVQTGLGEMEQPVQTGSKEVANLDLTSSSKLVDKPIDERTFSRSVTVRNVSDRNLSRFQIPSFRDFRKSRRLGLPLKSRSSSCFDYIADETIVEEDVQESVDGKPLFVGAGSNDKSYYRSRGYSLSSINKYNRGADHIRQNNDKRDGCEKGADDDSGAFNSGVTQTGIDNVFHADNSSDLKKTSQNNKIRLSSSKTKSVVSNQETDRTIIAVNKISRSRTKHSKTTEGLDRKSKNQKLGPEVPMCPCSPDQALGDELEHGLDSDTSLVEEGRNVKSASARTLQAENMRAHHWRKRENKFRKKFFPDHEGFVNRSTSDVSDIYAEEERTKGVKEKRQKPYKSDPFGGKSQRKLRPTGFEGDELKEELLNLVKDVQQSSLQSLESNVTASSVLSVDSCLDEFSSDDKPNPIPPPRRKSKRKKKKKECDSVSGAAKQTDSLRENSIEEQLSCTDCDRDLEDKTEQVATPSGENGTTPLCEKCAANREERKRIINEVLLTEAGYGKDLKVIQQEFYHPLKSNGLLTTEQVATIFINLEELIVINNHFVKKLEDLLATAKAQGDQDLFNLNIGRLFLHSTNMLLAFETYCIDHSEALVTLETLEREKEILRIFLAVSQADNSALRRMPLKAFLMVPVQRIMKYPLLLNRLYKMTTVKHHDREDIKTARKKIEDILEHINYKTKGTASIRFRKSAVQQLKQKAAIYEDLESHKIAMETVGWNKNEVNIVYSGKLLLGNMPDLNTTKRNKLVKYANLQAVLLTLGKGPTWETKHSDQAFPLAIHSTSDQVRECALVLLKEKAATYVTYREPYYLDRCIIAMDADVPEMFELQEMSRLSETFLCKGGDQRDTVIWYNHLKFLSHGLGKWRKRRNAMPNIMIELGKT